MLSGDIKSFKIVLIGDPGVGKTSLLKNYLGSGFRPNQALKIGADFGIKEVILKENSYFFQICDLSSNRSFAPIRSSYFNEVDSIIAVFDLTNEDTLYNLINWFNDFQQNSSKQQIRCILIGNKEDQIIYGPTTSLKSINNIKRYISEQINSKVKFITTSANNGLNLTEAFDWIFQKMLQKQVDCK
ncbi:MAG: Rab family GTPase [Candidatus Kariarchaeaceae archaeon]|jgi:small GTP-binding protein